MMDMMDAIMTAVEAIINVINELVYSRAFCKEKPLRKRIAWIFLYVIVLVGIICGSSYLMMILLPNENGWIGYFFLVPIISCVFLLIYPLIEKNKMKKIQKKNK